MSASWLMHSSWVGCSEILLGTVTACITPPVVGQAALCRTVPNRIAITLVVTTSRIGIVYGSRGSRSPRTGCSTGSGPGLQEDTGRVPKGMCDILRKRTISGTRGCSTASACRIRRSGIIGPTSRRTQPCSVLDNRKWCAWSIRKEITCACLISESGRFFRFGSVRRSRTGGDFGFKKTVGRIRIIGEFGSKRSGSLGSSGIEKNEKIAGLYTGARYRIVGVSGTTVPFTGSGARYRTKSVTGIPRKCSRCRIDSSRSCPDKVIGTVWCGGHSSLRGTRGTCVPGTGQYCTSLAAIGSVGSERIG